MNTMSWSNYRRRAILSPRLPMDGANFGGSRDDDRNDGEDRDGFRMGFRGWVRADGRRLLRLLVVRHAGARSIAGSSGHSGDAGDQSHGAREAVSAVVRRHGRRLRD